MSAAFNSPSDMRAASGAGSRVLSLVSLSGLALLGLGGLLLSSP